MAKKLSRRDAIQALRVAISERPEIEWMWKRMWDYHLKHSNVESDDRATALVLGSFLEQALELGILSHCLPGMSEEEQRRLFGAPSEAPMTFDVKIRLGYALGLYGPDSRDDLTCIRHIRNLFAHGKSDLRFGSGVISDVCDHLKYIDKMQWGGIMGEKPTSARRKFIETVRHYFAWCAARSAEGKPVRYTEYVLPDLYA